MMDFSTALLELKIGRNMRRASWRAGRFVHAVVPHDHVHVPFLMIVTDEGRGPYTPSHCDLFASDWEWFST